MPGRIAVGELPARPHTALRSAAGALRFEHCLTTRGFEGPYAILYHVHPPHQQAARDEAPHPIRAGQSEDRRLRKRHYRTDRFEGHGERMQASLPIAANEDVAIAITTPTVDDAAYLLDGDHDRLIFVVRGRGVLRSVFGDLRCSEGDYVVVPRGVLHRLIVDAPMRLLEIGCSSSVDLLARHRNPSGQLRMDAPIGDRDLRTPTFVGPVEEGLRELRVIRGGAMHRFDLAATPLDVVGWDGAIYPFALPITAFRPRVGAVHLPPDGHGTFAARGVLVSSFVPRPCDFGEGAIPCPYPHSSVDCDELLFYVRGDFLSRRGIAAGSLTLHPAGLPHGPRIEAYESSLGRARVDELAIMLDLDRPLGRCASATSIEDPDYHASYLGDGG